MLRSTPVLAVASADDLKETVIMRKTIAVGLTLAAVPAVSWATDQSINLTANVPKFCKFDASPTINSLNNVSVTSASPSASVITVTTPTNATGVMNDAGFNFSIQATCNFASQVVMTSLNGGLTDTTPEPIVSGTFLRRIDYSALATWDSAPIGIFSTTGVAGASSTPQRTPGGANSGPLNVAVGFIRNPTAPLAAGDYTDTLKISLTPQ